MYVHRTTEKELPNLDRNFKVLLVSGMRQVGKSTLLQHLVPLGRGAGTLSHGFRDCP